MASVYVKCKGCLGNVWPPGQMDHLHLDAVQLKATLKKKYRTISTGRKGAARPRTNSPASNKRTIKPRRKAYGPF